MAPKAKKRGRGASPGDSVLSPPAKKRVHAKSADSPGSATAAGGDHRLSGVNKDFDIAVREAVDIIVKKWPRIKADSPIGIGAKLMGSKAVFDAQECKHALKKAGD